MLFFVLADHFLCQFSADFDSIHINLNSVSNIFRLVNSYWGHFELRGPIIQNSYEVGYLPIFFAFLTQVSGKFKKISMLEEFCVNILKDST